jgi:FixJ family two-component response regulator
MTTETVSFKQHTYGITPAFASRSSEARAMADKSPIIFVVDDDVSVRESLEMLVESAGWCAETFGSGQEFLARPRCTVPCCLLLDVSLPDLNGLDVQQQLAERHEMPIVFITGHGDVPMTVRAMKAGAVEFLTKPLEHEVLLEVIRESIDRSRVLLRVNAEMGVIESCYRSLTPREREVMLLVVKGRLNKQIGGELGISEITVKAHRGQVMRKMQAASLPELVTMAARLGLQPAASD